MHAGLATENEDLPWVLEAQQEDRTHLFSEPKDSVCMRPAYLRVFSTQLQCTQG